MGSLIVVLGSVLPWGSSGRADRSGFELVRVARRLDVLDGTTAAAARLWLLAPLALAAVVIAAGARRSVPAVAVGTALAVGTLVLVAAVHRSPVVPRFGLHVSAAGAVVVFASDLWFAIERLRHRD